MSAIGADSVALAIAKHVPSSFDPPWTDYAANFGSDPELIRKIELLYFANRESKIKDIDLARLNLRRALCQMLVADMVAPTLDDPAGRLYRDNDFPLICGFLGVKAIQPLARKFGQIETSDLQRKLIVAGLAQILAWNSKLEGQIDAILTTWLSTFPMQNRLTNGWLAAAARTITSPSGDLELLIKDSKSLPQYFETYQISLAVFERSALFRT